MRDLKHLIYFENLLQQANNDLVQAACGDGRLALAWNCSYIPEVLLDTDKCFGVRLRAPNCTNPDMATYYMTNRSCPYSKSILERAFEGGYNFIDAQLGTETCAGTCRFQEHLAELPDLIQNEKFFVTFTDVPFKKNENSIEHFAATLQKHVLDELHEHFGIDTSDEALRATIEAHNEICDIITQIGEFRKLDKPTITGTEFHIINLVSMVCPKYLILPYLRETLEDLKTREADAKPNYRVKVVLAGSENDDPDFTKLVESCGALVVADRYCYGSLPGREKIEIRKGETALRAVARHYLETSVCPRSMEQSAMRQRKKYIADVAKEYKADGVIVESNKFCEYWSYERVADTIILPRDFGLPVCSIEKEYINSASGQLRTRFQAFVESLEIKKIQEKEGAKNG